MNIPLKSPFPALRSGQRQFQEPTAKSKFLAVRRTKAKCKEIGDAMNRAAECWGRPHIHGGIGIRRLTKSIYECRVGPDYRLAFLFPAQPPGLEFFFLGNYDEIRKLIKGRT